MTRRIVSLSILGVVSFGLIVGLILFLNAASILETAPPEADDAISAAELEDLQFIASQSGISLQAAIDKYAWQDNFSLAVSKIREAAPSAFTGAEIVGASSAWVAFAGSAPQAASNIIATFSSNHSSVSVEIRTNQGFTEEELLSGMRAVHSAIFGATEVTDAFTSFDFATGKITTVAILKSTAATSALDDLRAVAGTNLTEATRADIVDSITTAVVRSNQQVLGGDHSGTQHQGGENLNVGETAECTSGFVVENSSGTRGIATAGHCHNDLTDDGVSLQLENEHYGLQGDFQWHTGTQEFPNEFYGGISSGSEVSSRNVSSVASPSVGQTLCRNGRASNKTCQEVRKANVCISTDNGDQCYLTIMGEKHSQTTDSGGPVYLSNTAYGIHKGWVYDPWPFTRDVFSRADNIYSALGVNIVTD